MALEPRRLEGHGRYAGPTKGIPQTLIGAMERCGSADGNQSPARSAPVRDPGQPNATLVTDASITAPFAADVV